MTKNGTKPDWTGMADRLQELSEELLAAASSLPDEIDDQIIQLQSVSLRHYSLHLRMIASE